MLENLNKLSFQKFGEILSGAIPEEKDTHGITVVMSDEEFYRFPDTAVYLERKTGIPALIISGDDFGTQHKFYLDKPVKLNPGVWFRILTTVEDDCVYKIIPKEAEYETRALTVKDEEVFSPTLAIYNIYTLFYQEREKGFFFAGEQHRPYELVYVDSGILHSVTNGQDFVLEQGDLMVYARDQWHMQYGEKEHSVCFITISFDMDCPYSDIIMNRKLSAGNEAKKILSQLLEEQNNSHILRDDLLQCKLRELFIYLIRKEQQSSESKVYSVIAASSRQNIIDSAQRYIADNLYRHLTVEGIAKDINVSVSYMSAIFRNSFGMPPSRYIRRAKLEEGKRMIREASQPISIIASALGYSTLQHFSRCFKTEFGVTPSEYAKALR